MPRAVKVLTPPASEPVTTDEAKKQCRVDSSDDDTFIEDDLIPSAREWIERRIGRSLITQTIRLTLDSFPGWIIDGRFAYPESFGDGGKYVIDIPRPPLIAISSIKYDDANGTEQTWSSSYYRVDADSEPGRLTPVFNQVYPVTLPSIGAVRIVYTAGYGAAASSVPYGIKRAMKLVIGEWYLDREAKDEGRVSDPTLKSVDRLLATYWTGVYS